MSINEKYVPTEKQLVEQYADMLVALNHVDAEECRAMVRETFRRAKEAAWDEGFVVGEVYETREHESPASYAPKDAGNPYRKAAP